MRIINSVEEILSVAFGSFQNDFWGYTDVTLERSDRVSMGRGAMIGGEN